MNLPLITVVMRPMHVALVFAEPATVQVLSVEAASQLVEALVTAIRAITMTDERTRVH